MEDNLDNTNRDNIIRQDIEELTIWIENHTLTPTIAIDTREQLIHANLLNQANIGTVWDEMGLTVYCCSVPLTGSERQFQFGDNVSKKFHEMVTSDDPEAIEKAAFDMFNLFKNSGPNKYPLYHIELSRHNPAVGHALCSYWTQLLGDATAWNADNLFNQRCEELNLPYNSKNVIAARNLVPFSGSYLKGISPSMIINSLINDKGSIELMNKYHQDYDLIMQKYSVWQGYQIPSEVRATIKRELEDLADEYNILLDREQKLEWEEAVDKLLDITDMNYQELDKLIKGFDNRVEIFFAQTILSLKDLAFRLGHHFCIRISRLPVPIDQLGEFDIISSNKSILGNTEYIIGFKNPDL